MQQYLRALPQYVNMFVVAYKDDWFIRKAMMMDDSL